MQEGRSHLTFLDASCHIKTLQESLSTFFFFATVVSVLFHNLPPLKPIKLIYIYLYTSESITLGTQIQLLFKIVCLCMCYYFTFIIAVPLSPKYITSILCIYGLFAAKGKQQGVWHTGSCKLSIALAVILFYLFIIANKGRFFPVWFCSFSFLCSCQ